MKSGGGNIPAPFLRATFTSLIVCLYLAYSKLLKLTVASNAGVYEKLAILDEYLVDHCWMVTCDQHLNDRISLSHVRRRPRVDALMNGTATATFEI